MSDGNAPARGGPGAAGRGGGSGPLRYVLHTPVLRSAHLERLAPLPGVDLRVLATDRHPDLDDALLAAPPVAVELLDVPAALARLAADPPDVLEVTEPGWVAEAGLAAACARVVRDAALLRGAAPPRVVTYAIDNLLPDGVAATWPLLADVAFGTRQARDTYAAAVPALLGRLGGGVVVPERRPRCPTCFPDASQAVRSGRRPAAPEVVLAAELSERKGVDVLLDAWERLRVDPERPADGWTLRLLGWGPRAQQVREHVDAAVGRGRSDLELVLGEPGRGVPRAQVHAALARAAVVVLPSRRTDRWREQVGLSLVEGAAHGCHLVTTDETGLAEDLRGRDDADVVAAGDADALADGLRHALRVAGGERPLPAPDRDGDGRLAAVRALAGRAAAALPR